MTAPTLERELDRIAEKIERLYGDEFKVDPQIRAMVRSAARAALESALPDYKCGICAKQAKRIAKLIAELGE